jgi:RNA polymerase sigma-70 factor (ECF subfamily)
MATRVEEKNESTEPDSATWQRYREGLDLLARLLLAQTCRAQPWLRAKLAPSDLVQQSLLIAYRRRESCQATTDSGRQAWLRGILRNVLAEAVRDLTRDKRDAFRERSLEGALTRSSLRMDAWLADRGVSPEEQAMRAEQFLRLAAALARLPERQRRAVELHHLMQWPLKETAQELECSLEAVAGLIHRGLVALRKALEPTGGT